MQGLIYVIGLSFSIFSCIVTAVVIALHILIPKLLKHPGQYVFLQCLCQLAYDFHWCISYTDWDDRNPEICKWEALMLVSAYNCGLIYMSILGIELCCKFKNKGSVSYFKRTLVYHITSLGLTGSITITILCTGGYGHSSYRTCTATNPHTTYIEYIISASSLITMVSSLLYLILNKSKHSWNIIKHYSYIIFFVLLTWLLPSLLETISLALKIEALDIIGYLVGTLSGTLIGLSRIINHKLYRQISKRVLGKEKRYLYLVNNILGERMLHDSTISLIEGLASEQSHNYSSIFFYGDVYDNISTKVLIT